MPGRTFGHLYVVPIVGQHKLFDLVLSIFNFGIILTPTLKKTCDDTDWGGSNAIRLYIHHSL